MIILRYFRFWRACALLFIFAIPSAVNAQPTGSADNWAEKNRQESEQNEPNGGPLTLGDALSLALSNSPQLSAFDLEVRARDAHALQASLRPNPELSLEVENFAGSGNLSGFGAAEVTLSLAQLIELGGKRAKRHNLANIESQLASWDYKTVRLEVFNAVARTFVAVVAAQQQMTLANTLIEVAQQDVAAVSKRVKAGAASPIELTRARVAHATAKMDLETKTFALIAARVQLAATWGSDQPVFGSAIGSLQQISAPPGLDRLKRRLKSNPDIERWQTELAQRRASLELEQAVGKIDLVATGGFRRIEETGDNSLVAGITIPLPFSNQNQGNVKAAEFRLLQVEKERLSALVSANAALAMSHSELAAAYQAANTLLNVILPEAQEAMATAESAYLKGLFNFTDVLAVRMTYFELRSRNIAFLARYHIAAADIERLINGQLSEVKQELEQP